MKYVHQSTRFNFAVKNIKKALEQQFHVNVIVDSKDFIRILIDSFL